MEKNKSPKEMEDDTIKVLGELIDVSESNTYKFLKKYNHDEIGNILLIAASHFLAAMIKLKVTKFKIDEIKEEHFIVSEKLLEAIKLDVMTLIKTKG